MQKERKLKYRWGSAWISMAMIQTMLNIVAVKPMAGHKGYALAFMIDMLCGPLNGMNLWPQHDLNV